MNGRNSQTPDLDQMAQDMAGKFTDKFTGKGKLIGLGVAGVITLSSALYTVPEGHIGIVTRFGEGIDQTTPGLHLKMPFVDSVKNLEIRTRKYQLKLLASTTGRETVSRIDGKPVTDANPVPKADQVEKVELQMPSTVVISANWSIPPDKALAVFKEYGSLEQYEDRILDPRVKRITKQQFAKYNIEQVVSERETVRQGIDTALTLVLQDQDVIMSDVNIEDVNWSSKIRKAIEKKQTAKLSFEAENYELQKQNLQAQREVNTADAKAQGIDKVSVATANKIQREGVATAAALEAKAKVLRSNPQLVEMMLAERWDGALSVVGGGDSGLLLDINAVMSKPKGQPQPSVKALASKAVTR